MQIARTLKTSLHFRADLMSVPILSRRVVTMSKLKCSYESSGGNMFLLSVSNMPKFINCLKPIL